jgi:HK97 family phage major capsid protein
MSNRKKPKTTQQVTPDQIRQATPNDRIALIRGQRVERTFTLDRDGLDEENRTAWMSISSEAPYERYWGIEILDHNPKSIRSGRMSNGAALLVGHDPADQVGVVERFEITSDKRMRILARFSRSQRAEEIFRDVIDGIRRNTSVGYMIHDLVLERKDGDIVTYRVTDWEPYEGSIVSIPADPTVGIGRSDADDEVPVQLINEEKQMTDEMKNDNKPVDIAAIQAREVQRINDLMVLGDEYATYGGKELARELIRDPSANLDVFKARILEKMKTAMKPIETAEPAAVPYGAGARHIIARGRQLRSFTKPLMYTDGSKMEAEEAAYRSGQWLLATVGQNERARRWCNERGITVETRVMTAGTDSAGGYLVPVEMEQSIIDLRESYGLARRLARRRPMSSDTKSIPKRTGGVTAYFVNEDNDGVTASDKSWGNVNLVAKTLAALSLISKNLEEDSIIDVVDDLAQEMAYAFATKEDDCWLNGDGTSTYGGMQGLRTLFDATAYSSRVTAASGHDTFAEYDNSDLSAVMGAVADFPGINPVWLCSKTFAENVFGRLKRTAGGVSETGLDTRVRYGYGGYEAFTSELMPKVGTSAVTTVEAFFGDFSMSSSFGDRRGIMVEVLRERYAEKLQVGILGHERFHIVNHDLGSTSVKGPVAALKGE